MKVIYIDCISGISGDMTVAALLDLGVDRESFKNELSKINVDGYSIEITDKEVNGIKGVDFYVKLEDNHEHVHSHEHHHHHHVHRNLIDIEEIIDKSTISSNAKDMAKKIFYEVAKAESAVHGKELEEVHFHEVGAVDSIVDIVAVAICIDMLGIEKIYSSSMVDGRGFIECQHGTIPVPVPAVMQMLSGTDIPMNILNDVNTELTTPTGMAIAKVLSDGFGKMPNMSVKRIGYGMGKRNTGKFNALRIVYGEIADNSDTVSVIETNIDDTTAEILGYTMDCLFEAGAKDVFCIPIQMKKNRLGTLIKVICDNDKKEEMIDIIFRETSSIGVRIAEYDRVCMERKKDIVKTCYGDVEVKRASYKGIEKVSAEYESCKQRAVENNVALNDVYKEVLK